MSGSSSTAHSTVYINLTASTEKLDSYSTARHPGTCSQPRQPRQLLDRSSTGSTGKASTAPRQSTRQRLDGASTARQLDSQGSNRRRGRRKRTTNNVTDDANKRTHIPIQCSNQPKFTSIVNAPLENQLVSGIHRCVSDVRRAPRTELIWTPLKRRPAARRCARAPRQASR